MQMDSSMLTTLCSMRRSQEMKLQSFSYKFSTPTNRNDWKSHRGHKEIWNEYVECQNKNVISTFLRINKFSFNNTQINVLMFWQRTYEHSVTINNVLNREIRFLAACEHWEPICKPGIRARRSQFTSNFNPKHLNIRKKVNSETVTNV